jgi:hypothetical protein
LRSFLISEIVVGLLVGVGIAADIEGGRRRRRDFDVGFDVDVDALSISYRHRFQRL